MSQQSQPDTDPASEENPKGPQTLADWIRYSHAALTVPKDDPLYERAQEAFKTATAHIGELVTTGKKQDAGEAAMAELTPGTLGSAVANFGEGASLGLASKLGNRLPGTKNSEYIAAAREAHPVASYGGDLLGGTALGIALSRLPGVKAMTPAIQGATIGGGTGAARFAVDDPLGDRLTSGIVGGVLGGTAGLAAGKIAQWTGPSIRAAANDLRQTAGKVIGRIRGAPAEAAPAAAGPSLAEQVAKANPGMTVEQAQAGIDRQAARTAARAPSSVSDGPPGTGNAPRAQQLPIEGNVSAGDPVAQQMADASVARPERVIGEDAFPGKPDLGKWATPGKYQKAAPPVRVQSPAATPLGHSSLDRTNPKAVAGWLKDQMALAQKLGQPITTQRLTAMMKDFDPKVVQAVIRELGGT